MIINSQAPSNFYLTELIEVLNPIKITKLKNVQITTINHNSKQVTPGSLFVAIAGFNTDGHQYIKEAINQGAKAVIGEQDLQLSAAVPYIQVTDSRKALARLAVKFYNYPSDKLKTVGVTGSSGKTTTTKMINNIFRQETSSTGLIGTLHTKIRERTFSQPKECTTPEALELNQRLYAMHQQDIEYVTMEVSSHALKLDRVYGLDFDLALFTNLSYDHLNFHKNLQDYYQSKEKLFTQLTYPARALLNRDDKNYQSLIESLEVPHFSYGLDKKSNLTAKKIVLTKQDSNFTAHLKQPVTSLTGQRIQPFTLPLKLKVIGRHNIYNALGALLTGLMFDLSLTKIKQGLESFTGVSRRMELVSDQKLTIIDDFAHNPGSLKASFKTINQFDYNKLIIVHFLKGKRGTDANQRNAQLIMDWRRKLNLTDLIVTCAENQIRTKNKVLPAEKEAFAAEIDSTTVNFTIHKQLKPALKQALSLAKPDDLLLLIGGPGLDKAQAILKNLRPNL